MPENDEPTEGTDQQEPTSDDTTQREPHQEPTGKQTDTDDTDQDTGKERKPKTFTQEELDRLLTDRLNRERKKFADYNALQKKAKEYDKLQDAQKTELEKLNDQLTAAQVELQGFRVAEIRRAAAAEVGLDPELAQFITAAEHDEAITQARTLADKFKPAEPKRTDLKQGTRAQPKQTISQDDYIRRMAGYTT